MGPAQPLRHALNQAARELDRAGVDCPLPEARVLLAHALDVPLSRLDLLLKEPMSTEAADRYQGLVIARAARRPLAYITGETEFMGLRFRCDERALVPRPETEILVEAVLDRLRARDPAAIILDVGAGTGVIGLSLAVLLPGARAILTDISREALALSPENAEALNVTARVQFLCGPGLEPALRAGLAEDITCVVSNPPYIAPAHVPSLPPEVALHEPQSAWLGEGETGLGVYERLIPQCAHRLPNLNLIAFEVGLGQAVAVGRLCEQAWPPFHTRIVKDLSGLDRVVLVERG